VKPFLKVWSRFLEGRGKFRNVLTGSQRQQLANCGCCRQEDAAEEKEGDFSVFFVVSGLSLRRLSKKLGT